MRFAIKLVFYGALSFGAHQVAAQEANLNVALAVQSAVVDAIATAETSVVALARGKKGEPNSGLVDSTFVPYEYGTGVVVDRRGLILTNYHLLGDIASSVYSVWHQGRVYYPARVRAADPWSDLAVLEIDAEDLNPISMGDGANLKKGQFVVSLGNPFGIARDGSVSATWGIVSNLSRRIANVDPLAENPETMFQHGMLIQTDAKLKNGTSGGPLVDLRGNMVALVTSAKALSGFDSNAHYAVPITVDLRRIIDRLKLGQKPRYGFLGVQPEELSLAERQDGRRGVRLRRVFQGSPASQYGLLFGDIITHLNNQPVRHPDDLLLIVGLAEPESKLRINLARTDPILRRTRTLTKTVTVSKKFIGARRPVFATTREPNWRGVMVDYPTAVAEFQRLSSSVPSEGCVAVTNVDEASPAWNAGIRVNDLITKVNGVRVQTPDVFFEVAKRVSDVASIELARSQSEFIVLPPTEE